MREQHEAHALPLQGRVSARLVIRLDSGEAVPEPRPGRRAVELEDPGPQPAALESARGEVPVEGLGGGEPRTARPAGSVQIEEHVQVLVEPTRIVRKPEAEAALAEPALGCAHLLPEVRAARCEELLPRR